MERPEQVPGQGESDRSPREPEPDKNEEREWVIAQIQESFRSRDE